MFTNVAKGSTSQFFITILTAYLLCLINAQPYDYPSANLSTLWTNSVSANHSLTFADKSIVRAILLRGAFGPRYASGFYCNGINCTTYLFGIFIVQTNSGGGLVYTTLASPQLVWSANRNKPVQINSTLELTSQGDLVLKDADRTIAWNTNTSGKNVVGLNLTELGNLVLFDEKNATVWQSFDHPTDSLVPGQKLRVGQKLVADVSAANSSESLTSFSLSNEGLFARMESNPPQIYQSYLFDATNATDDSIYVEYLNGSIALFLNTVRSRDVIKIPESLSAQFIKLGSDGHLKVYEWRVTGWDGADIFTGFHGACDYPQVCGDYGICSNGQCSCPASSNGTSYFKQINDGQPTLGCSEVTPLSCEDSRNQGFLELVNVTYFYFSSDLKNVDSQTCKKACGNNCSCKAAFFLHDLGSSIGDCYLPSQLFSLMNNDVEFTHSGATAYIKVQESPTSVPSTVKSKVNRRLIILGATVGSVFALILLLGAISFYKYKKQHNKEEEEDYLDQVPGMPSRFSYAEMKIATKDFSMKLGKGGFGAVFKGTLPDGLEVAVKCLDGIGHIRKSFLAEVETIGRIHHVNLVRLVGFCAEKFHRLLVYEYMSNGSLDKWISNKNNESALNWEQRKKIIFDIAKGLNYLHEDCRQKIIHLDIKPENILLDKSFHAKVSDFGLSMLIDRDQSQVIASKRGTPGYLAPERRIGSMITEKVDVYSFGVVILEMVCGRKNFDGSQKEEDMYLLSLFQRKAEAGEWLDMVDKNNEDMQLRKAEAVSIMKVAAWCLQGDFAKRPSMSTVIKVLDGTMEVEDGLSYDFWSLSPTNTTRIVGNKDTEYGASTPLLPSVLSGPR